MKMTWRALLFSVVVQGMVASVVRAEDGAAGVYGSAFKYDSGATVAFPDFKINYDGTEPGANFPGSSRRMGDVVQFKVESGGKSEVKSEAVSWSGGTGDIGPSFFRVGEQCFRLELRVSDKAGKIEEGMAVISREGEGSYCR